MTDAQDIYVSERDTMLTARKRANLTLSTNFLGYITDASGNYFVDASGNKIFATSQVQAPTYTVSERDTMLTRKDRE